MRRRVAILISNILNPFILSLLIILLISFQSADNALDTIKWSAILIAATTLPVYLFIAYLVRSAKLDSHFIAIRKQRNKVYLLASVCVFIASVILFFMGASSLLLAVIFAGLFITVIFMGINLWWKISLHSAFISASVTLLIILFGPVAAVGVILVLLVGWSRVELGRHSIAQVTIGIFLAALITSVIFYLFEFI